MTTQGVDYAGDHPDPTGLYQVGKRFAVRYFGPGGDWKHASLTECKSLTAAGLSIVCNAEGTANGLLGGAGVGAEWARLADTHARGYGMPADRPIYLSVDFDCQPDQWPMVKRALDGAAGVIGRDRVGVYGSYDVIAWAVRDRAARWFWQTYAWSSDRWHAMCHLRQYRNGVSLVGGTVDLCSAHMTDYGQWTVGASPPPDNGGSAVATWTANQITAVTERVLAVLEGTDPVAWTDEAGKTRTDDNTLHRKLAEIAQAVTETGQGSTEGLTEAIQGLTDAVNQLTSKVDELESAPLIDATAVAAAIAANPEVSGALATAVAARLGRLSGEITMSGSLTGAVAASDS